MSSRFRADGARPLRQRVTHSHAPRRTLVVVVAVVSGTGLLAAACSAASSGTASNGSVSAPRGPAFGGAAAHAPAPAPGAAPRAAVPATTDLTKLVPPAQSIIYTANLVFRARPTVTAAAAIATSIVTAVGGYVAGEQETVPPGGGGVAQISLDLKVPVAQYRPTLAKLAVIGRQLSFNQQALDVTQQVADVSSRVASAQAAIKQLRALLSRAGSVGDLLSVQDEINAQESDLESLLAQQQALAHETSYATVSVLLLGHHAVIVKKHKKKSHGFVAGLAAGWRAFGAAVVWLLTALGTLLPFLVSLALVGGIGYAGWRRLARRRMPPTAAPPPAAS
jgi:hypothetical protein